MSDKQPSARELAEWLRSEKTDELGVWSVNHDAKLEAAATLLISQSERIEATERALVRHGYSRSCDIPACNCGDNWTHGGYAAERLRELGEVLYENGETALTVAKEWAERIEALEAENERLRAELASCSTAAHSREPRTRPADP